MSNEMSISKGSFSVKMYSDNFSEGFTNKLFTITPATSPQNQSEGPATPKVIDLLRIEHDITIKGFIVGTVAETAKQVKEELISIYRGGGADGGTTTLVYDGDTYNGFIQTLVIVEEPQDLPDDFESNSTAYQDIARYNCTIKFIEGAS